ncbi:hypothetical protein HDV00_010705 [Rhizophlyctis rosea]|nr:hypothetical protein HDV00_010705 [Rhizophlyctis rosea]
MPAELLPRKAQKQVLPYLSPQRVLSKAEQWATDWFHRTKKLVEADAYHERIRVNLNLPEKGIPLTPKNVKVVNLDELANHTVRGVNDGVGPSPPPPPQLFPALPPTLRNKGKEPAHNVAQLNPLTRELSTTSTQTMRKMADKSTSARATIATGSTQTDVEPMTGGELAKMATDAPLQQIVHYHSVSNNYLTNHHNNYLYNQVLQDQRVAHNVVNNDLLQQNVLQQIAHRPSVHNNLTIETTGPGQFGVPVITGRNQAVIAAPPNANVNPAALLHRGYIFTDLPANKKRKAEQDTSAEQGLQVSGF